MAELKEGQQIIFKHPANGGIRVGSYSIGWVSYCVSGFPTDVPFSEITEWCDAPEAWNALTSQNIRMTPKGEYKLTFEIFGQKRRCSIMARSIEEAKTILLEQVKKQVVILKSEYTEPEQQYNEAIDDLAKMFGFKP